MSKPTILVAEDDPAIRLVVSQTLTASGYAVRATASPDALQRWIRDGEGDVVVTDVYLGEDPIFDVMPGLRMERPDLPFIVMSGQNTVLTAASAADHGAFDYLPKPFDIDDLSNLVARALRKPTGSRRISREIKRAEEDAVLPLIGRSEAMQGVYRAISRVMNTDLTVLIEGEAGSGKELSARAIHSLGKRKASPFIFLDLNRPWRDIEYILGEVGGGVLYVDEVGDLSAPAQGTLIDVMRQLGNAQLVTSSRHDLAAKTRAGEFRQDLYYRLAVIRVAMPPLRARKEDIPELSKAFLARSGDLGIPARTFESAAMDLLTTYEWPGNVRELENLVIRLGVLSPDTQITVKDVEETLRVSLPKGLSTSGGLDKGMSDLLNEHVIGDLMSAGSDGGGRVHQQVIEAVERPLIKLALSITSGNKVRAAALLGVNRNTLRAKITALGLGDDEPDAEA